jgi:anti-sigma factor RsiW
MKSQRLLLRLLHGELPEAEARTLRERLASDPELAAQYSRLNRVWGGWVGRRRPRPRSRSASPRG